MLSGRNIATISNPVGTPMVVDGVAGGNGYCSKSGSLLNTTTGAVIATDAVINLNKDVLPLVSLRHTGGFNACFADGHVAYETASALTTSFFSPCINPAEGVQDYTSLIINSGDIIGQDYPTTPYNDPGGTWIAAWGEGFNWDGMGIVQKVQNNFVADDLLGLNLNGNQSDVCFTTASAYSPGIPLDGNGCLPTDRPLGTPPWWAVGPGNTTVDSVNTDSNKYVGSNIYCWPPIQGLWNFAGQLDTLPAALGPNVAQPYTMTIVPSEDDGSMNIAMIVSAEGQKDSGETGAVSVIGGITSISIGAGTAASPKNTLTFANNSASVHVTTPAGTVYSSVGTSRAVGLNVPVRLGQPITINYFLEKANSKQDNGGCAFVIQRT
jgi:prepilin-type processing-associated H-X9-DG protein